MSDGRRSKEGSGPPARRPALPRPAVSRPATRREPCLSLRIADPAWRLAVPRAVQLVRRAAATALTLATPAQQAREAAILLADDATVRPLNAAWRGKDKPTNVLSFPGTGAQLGDIVIARETVLAEAAAEAKAPADHLAHLVVHGVLHLLGYDHETDAEAAIMEEAEIRLLATLGIGNPYEVRALPARHVHV